MCRQTNQPSNDLLALLVLFLPRTGDRRFHPYEYQVATLCSTETSPYSPLFPEEENQLNDKRKIAPMNERYLTANQALATTRIVATALLVSLTSLFSTSSYRRRRVAKLSGAST